MPEHQRATASCLGSMAETQAAPHAALPPCRAAAPLRAAAAVWPQQPNPALGSFIRGAALVPEPLRPQERRQATKGPLGGLCSPPAQIEPLPLRRSWLPGAPPRLLHARLPSIQRPRAGCAPPQPPSRAPRTVLCTCEAARLPKRSTASHKPLRAQPAPCPGPPPPLDPRRRRAGRRVRRPAGPETPLTGPEME